jgi:hypothetical protein
MTHRNGFPSLTVAAVFLCLALASCSQSEKLSATSAAGKPFTEEAKEAIQDYGRRPINKARITQGLGDQRTEAMDEAVKATAGK